MKIKISPALVVMAILLCGFGYYNEFLCYFITIIVHEFAHAKTAQKLGYSLNVMKLMPYGASLTGEFEGVKRSDEILIALAGPLINVILGVFFIALWWIAPDTYFFTEVFVVSNISTAIFNLLPVFPLDGGRMLLAFLSKWIKRNKAYFYMRIVSCVFAVLFGAFFLLSLIFKMNITFASIGIFIFLSAVFPDKNSKYQRLYSMAFRSEKIKNGLVVKEIMVKKDITFLELSRLINSNYYHRFIFTDEKFNPVCTLTEAQLDTLSARCTDSTKIFDLIK